MATVRIQVRRGTSADWSNVNPVLAAGEMGLETNTRKIKVGDGSTAWNSLDYVAADAPAIGEIAQDAINDALELGSGLTKTYNDGANTITIDIDTDVIATQTYVDSAIASLHGTADSSYIPMTDRGSANGVASLDSNTLVPNSQIDSNTWATKTYSAGFSNNAISSHNSETTNVHGISNTADLATKSYVDTAASNAVASVIDSAPSALNTLKELADALNDDASFASTVTSELDSKLNKSGGTMSGAIAMGNNKITGLAAPTSNGDAATKAYADYLQTQDVAALSFHNSNTQNIHGIADTAELATKSDVSDAVGTHNSDTTNVHGISNTANLSTKEYVESYADSKFNSLSSTVSDLSSSLSASISDEVTNRGTAVSGVQSNLTTHTSATTSVHGISNTANLVYTADSRLSDTRTPTDNTVSTAKIADSAVSTAKIADSAITSAKIADGTIVNGDINASAAIAATKIAGTAITAADTGTVTNTMLAGSIAPSKVTGTAITAADSGTVTSTMILDGTIVNGDINASAAIALSKLATDPLARANHTGTQTASTISNFDTQVRTSKVTDLAAPTGSFSMNSQKITNVATPTAGTDAANKDYVDAAVQNVNIHESVVAATTGNIALNSAVANNSVLDGVTLATGNRILVKNQNTASQNGVYIVAGSGAPTRATDYDAAGEVSSGDFIFVSGGTVNENTGWVQTAAVTTVGTDPLSFTQFSGAGTYTAGTGLTLSGTTFSINTASTVDLSTAQTLTNKTISGSSNTISNIGNSSLTNSSLTVNGTSISLGGSGTITAANPNALTIGTGLSGTSYSGSGAVTIAIDSTVATLTGSQTLTNKILTSPTINTPTLTTPTISSGALTLSSSGVTFTDGTQTKEGVPSRTAINQQSGTTYTPVLSDRDSLVECSNASAITVTIPPNSSVAYPVGTSIDILQTSTGQVTIAAGSGVTVNATPGLKLRTQWSSATLFKRATDTWVVLGDLSA